MKRAYAHSNWRAAAHVETEFFRRPREHTSSPSNACFRHRIHTLRDGYPRLLLASIHGYYIRNFLLLLLLLLFLLHARLFESLSLDSSFSCRLYQFLKASMSLLIFSSSQAASGLPERCHTTLLKTKRKSYTRTKNWRNIKNNLLSRFSLFLFFLCNVINLPLGSSSSSISYLQLLVPPSYLLFVCCVCGHLRVLHFWKIETETETAKHQVKHVKQKKMKKKQKKRKKYSVTEYLLIKKYIIRSLFFLFVHLSSYFLPLSLHFSFSLCIWITHYITHVAKPDWQNSTDTYGIILYVIFSLEFFVC